MDNFKNALRSLETLKKVDDYGMFQMTYFGDYGFDEFLKVGAKDQEELEAVIDKIVFKDMQDIEAKLNIVNPGCTAFCTLNDAGDVIYGRNYDFSIYSPPLQLITRPSNGYASVSTSSMMYLGYGADNMPSGVNANSLALLVAPYIAADGVNEKGVAISLLSVSEVDPPFCENKISINTTCVIRLVLDKAANVDEAIELLKQYNVFFSLGISCHYLIADASGRSVIIEFWDKDLKVVESPIASNFIAYNDLRISQGNAIERHDRVKKVIEDNKGVLNKEQTVDLLVDVGARSTQAGLGLQWSVIYNLTTLEGTIFANGKKDNLINFNLNGGTK